MIFKSLETGPLAVNCFIVADEKTREAAVIDPGGNVPEILMLLAEDKLTCRMIVNTHAHFDHVGGNADMKSATSAEIVTHAEEAALLGQSDRASMMFGMSSKKSPPADRCVKEGDTLSVGSIKMNIIELSGHNPCGIGLVIADAKKVIVGDTLFAGSIGRTDFPGGSFDRLIADIREKIFTLPDDYEVYPGHGPSTTVGREKRFNPFF